jgi:hypothetical protein
MCTHLLIYSSTYFHFIQAFYIYNAVIKMYKMSVPLLMLQILLVVLISMGRCTVIFVAAACLSKFSLHITFSSSLLSRRTTPRSKTHRLTLLPHYHLHSSIGRTTRGRRTKAMEISGVFAQLIIRSILCR